MKVCSVCAAEIPDRSHGLCQRCYHAEYYRRNRQLVIDRAAVWAKENKTKRRAIERRYRASHKKETRKKFPGPCEQCGDPSPHTKSGSFVKHLCRSCYRKQIWAASHKKEARSCVDCGCRIGPRSTRCRRCWKRWRYTNDAAYRAGHKERARRYLATDKGIEASRTHVRKRRAAMLACEGSVSREEWRTVLASFGHSCAYCHKKGVKLEMDHIIPLSKGGRHAPDNIVPACRPCNASKNAGPPPTPVQAMLL